MLSTHTGVTLTGLQIVDVSSVAYSNQRHQLQQVNCMNLMGSSVWTQNTKQHFFTPFPCKSFPLSVLCASDNKNIMLAFAHTSILLIDKFFQGYSEQ